MHSVCAPPCLTRMSGRKRATSDASAASAASGASGATDGLSDGLADGPGDELCADDEHGHDDPLQFVDQCMSKTDDSGVTRLWRIRVRAAPPGIDPEAGGDDDIGGANHRSDPVHMNDPAALLEDHDVCAVTHTTWGIAGGQHQTKAVVHTSGKARRTPLGQAIHDAHSKIAGKEKEGYVHLDCWPADADVKQGAGKRKPRVRAPRKTTSSAGLSGSLGPGGSTGSTGPKRKGKGKGKGVVSPEEAAQAQADADAALEAAAGPSVLPRPMRGVPLEADLPAGPVFVQPLVADGVRVTVDPATGLVWSCVDDVVLQLPDHSAALVAVCAAAASALCASPDGAGAGVGVGVGFMAAPLDAVLRYRAANTFLGASRPPGFPLTPADLGLVIIDVHADVPFRDRATWLETLRRAVERVNSPLISVAPLVRLPVCDAAAAASAHAYVVDGGGWPGLVLRMDDDTPYTPGVRNASVQVVTPTYSHMRLQGDEGSDRLRLKAMKPGSTAGGGGGDTGTVVVTLAQCSRDAAAGAGVQVACWGATPIQCIPVM